MFEKLGYIETISFILLFIYSLLVINYSSRSSRMKDKLKSLKNNKSLWINVLFIVLFSFIMLNNSYFIKDIDTSKKIYKSTKHAIIAFIIAMLAHLELITSAFWLIWLATYYLI